MRFAAVCDDVEGRKPAARLQHASDLPVKPCAVERLIASFCEANPEVEVEIAASKELIDLAAEGFDAGIRLGQFIVADMVAVPLTPPFCLIVVGSPAYFAGRSRPKHTDDLRQHACLRWRRSSSALALWSFNDNGHAIEIAVSGPSSPLTFPPCLARR